MSDQLRQAVQAATSSYQAAHAAAAAAAAQHDQDRRAQAPVPSAILPAGSGFRLP